MNDIGDSNPPKKQKAFYGKLLNDIFYSSKTIKGDKQLTVELKFVADYREAMAEEREPRLVSPLTLTIVNNEDGTATMTITGSTNIKVEDKRGKLT